MLNYVERTAGNIDKDTGQIGKNDIQKNFLKATQESSNIGIKGKSEGTLSTNVERIKKDSREIEGVSNAENLAKVSLDTRKMSDIERTNYILEHTDLTREQVQDYLDINYYRNPEVGDAFRNEGIIKFGNNILMPRSTKYLDEDGFINWKLAPEKGYAFEKRALPYVEDATTHHVYEETGDLSNIRNDIINSSLSNLRKQELLNKLGDNKTYIGEAKGTYDQIGGAEQVETPLSIKELCEIGTLTER